MLHTSKILLTGITGSIGSWIARKALFAGERLLAVVRADTDDFAISRARAALNVVEADSLLDDVEVARGDICLEGLGLKSSTIGAARVSLIIHCAAALEFGEDFAERGRLVNVEGTANVLELAERLRVPVCHVSTAYVAGMRDGTVYEAETDVGQEFNNAYERSKCQAETLVGEWSRRTGLDVFIFRPSIVVGDTEGGRILNFDGLYNLMRFFDNVGGVVGKKEFRVLGNPNATKNFVPVDYVADSIWHIVRHGTPGTYHITHPSSIPLHELRRIFAELFGIPGAKFVNQRDFQSRRVCIAHRNRTPREEMVCDAHPTRLERLYQEATSHYLPYLMAEPTFDRTNTDRALEGARLDAPAIDADFFLRLLEYARRVKWGKKRAAFSSCPSLADAACCGPQTADSRTRHENVQRYFDEFLAEKMHKQLLPDLKSLSATCRINVEDIGRSWALRIEQGRLVKISHNHVVCQCAFLVDYDTFCRIVSGELVPQKAFFRRKIDVRGDIETGLKLATVLAEFFQKWPYHPGAEYGG